MQLSPAIPKVQKTAAQTTRNYRWQEAFWAYLFIAPSMLAVLVFTLAPVLTVLGISFTNWSILAKPEFIGIDNYSKLINDPLIGKVLWNTIFYTGVSVPLNLILSLAFAAALNQKVKGLALYRTAYFLPVISASVAVSVIWMWLLDSNNGLINNLLISMHITPVNWLTDPKWAMLAIIIVSVWRGIGWNMIIFLAALQDVPEDLYDAARIDGAGGLSIFRHITLPIISPAIFFVTIMGVIGSFQGFDLVYNMTPNGGPDHSTTVIGYYIWQQAFRYSRMGYGAALAYVLFLMILIITLIQWRARRIWVFGEE
jgi:multiple sugar transport system permease protein